MLTEECKTISKDGSTMVVGANQDCLDASGGNHIYYAGAAIVFIKSGVNWVIQFNHENFYLL